jgi:DNA-binding NarL/FixJ family response regulator
MLQGNVCFKASNISVLIVDDHPVVRNGLQSLLSQYDDMNVIGEAANCTDALECMGRLNPDVNLIDIKLADESGIALARRALRKYPKQRIIIITSYDDEEYFAEAVQIGVDGYLLKSASPELLAETIRAVYKGDKCLSPDMGNKAFSSLQAVSRELITLRLGLTDEDIKILGLVADGLQVVEIAEKLYVSERTIKRRVQEILTKLGVKTRAQAVAEAYERGIL